MAYKRKGIIARPGIHKRWDGTTEVITAEELKEAVQFQNRIPIVLKHPVSGHIDPKDRVGTVSQKWNEEKQVVEAEFWFLEESKYWDQIPKDLQRLIRDESQPIKTVSAGYRVPKKWAGDYKPRQWDHIAIDENNPMQDIGIEGSVRMESKFPEDFRIESESPEISGEPKEGSLPAKAEPYDPVNFGRMIGKLEAEVEQLRRELAESKATKQVQPAAPERTEETTVAEPEKTTTPDPPKPRTIVPVGASSKKDGPDEDGRFRIVVE